MMRRWMILFMVLLICSVTAIAAETDEVTSALPDTARELLGSPAAGQLPDARGMLRAALEKCGGEWSAAAGSAGMLCAVGAFCAAASLAVPEKAAGILPMVSAAAVAAVCGGSMKSMAALAKSVIDETVGFETVLLPVMATAAAGSGAPTGAAALYASSVAIGTALSRLLTAAVIPMIDCCLAVSLIQTAAEPGILGSAGSAMDSGIRHILRLTAFAFTAYLSLTGLLRGGADAMAVKSVRLASSTMVPLVGGMLADASETVLTSARLTLETVGGLGLAAVLAILLVPLMRIGIQRLFLWLAGTVCAMLGASKAAKQIEAVGHAMTLYAAVAAMVGLHAFVSAVCLLKVCTV